jgi:hypothetical protein
VVEVVALTLEDVEVAAVVVVAGGESPPSKADSNK